MRVIEKTSWSASSDVSVLPVIPCFVLDTTTTEFWYVTATESIKVSSGGGGAVSGVKGDAESTYRTGNVNLTPANIGALALTGGTVTGPITRNVTSGVGYIDSWTHAMAILNKTEDSNMWYPIAALRTKGGGGWAIGNYNDETLEFVYGSKANIESQTNTTTQISFTESGGANFPSTVVSNYGFISNYGSGGNYNEGIRINRATSGWATIALGGSANSVSGTADYQWFIGSPPTSNGRQLRIGHNNSGASTYFHTSANNNNVGLHLGGPLSFASATALPNASTSTDFFVTGINAFANGGTLKYKGLADMQTWLGIGDYKYAQRTSAIALSNGAMTTVASVQISAGTWVVHAHCQFATNATGYRFIGLSNANNSISADFIRWTGIQVQALSGAQTILATSTIFNFTATTTVYLVAQQGSGGSLNVSNAFIGLIRIK